eukprot:m.200894 g.200894  ORF g.200894 m.200894 type:complete len:676 (+) comp32781_c0_seq1:69-2096(+)
MRKPTSGSWFALGLKNRDDVIDAVIQLVFMAGALLVFKALLDKSFAAETEFSFDVTRGSQRVVWGTAENQAEFDAAVYHGILERPKPRPGWVFHSFMQGRQNINSKGAEIFPGVFRSLGWAELAVPTDDETNDDDESGPWVQVQDINAYAVRSPMVAHHRSWGRTWMRLRIFAAVALWAWAMRTLLYWGTQHNHRAKFGTRVMFVLALGVFFWHENLAQEFLGIGSDGSASSQSTVNSAWLKDNSTSRKSLTRLNYETISNPNPASYVDVVILVTTPMFDQLWRFLDWQTHLGPGCALINHQVSEWNNYGKDQFTHQVKYFSKQHGCDYRQVIPPTYFLNYMEDGWVANEDCVELFSKKNLGGDVLFVKDPGADGYGQGISLENFTTLTKRFNITSAMIADPKQLEAGCAQLTTNLTAINKEILVQEGIPPLFLWGQRKFDMRSYVLITDRAPHAVWFHLAYARFSDATKKKGINGSDILDRRQHVTNGEFDKRNFDIKDHWTETHNLEKLLGEDEAKPVLEALGLKTGAEAYAYLYKNLQDTVAQAMHAMVARAGTIRGGWVLIGIDTMIDSKLQAHMLETNVDPEFSTDEVRLSISQKVARRTYELLVETNAKSRELFSGRGDCFSQTFHPVSATSPAGKALTETDVPGWKLLYSNAVEPPFTALDGMCLKAP